MAAKGLGKGFDVLIPQDFDDTILTDVNDRVQNLFIDEITPNPDQPRRTFDDSALAELAASIKNFGILQPIIVSPKEGRYVIVAGERRWRAAKIAQLKEVPAIVREREELEQLEIALIENVQRVDLTPLEQAISIERLHQQFNMSYQSIADKLGKAHSTVHNLVRLLNLPEDARDALRSDKITEGHARAILALKDFPEKQQELLRLVMANKWTVRQAEQFVNSVKKGSEVSSAKKSTIPETPQTKRLAKKLNTKVTVKRTAKGGRIEIHYKTDDELDNLLNKFSKL